MAYNGIYTGSIPNDGTGDTLLTAAIKLESNFKEIYFALGDGDNITNTINNATLTGVSSISGITVSSGIITAKDLKLTGDLTVDGTTVTLNTETIVVEDKNIELGSTDTPTDITADGGGITLIGDTDHSITWSNVNDSWDFSENLNIITGKEYRINNSSILSSTTLGSSVINSSLTSFGNVPTATINNLTNININSTGIITTGVFSGNLENTLTLETSGTGLSGSTTFNNSGAATFTVTSNATSSNTNSTIVARDGSGNFSAGIITATTFDGDLTGNADTATALETARTFEITGDIIGSPISFDGTGNVSIAATIQPNSVALGTDTTGSYIATISGTVNEIEVSGSGDETAAVTISLPEVIILSGVDASGVVTASSFDGNISLDNVTGLGINVNTFLETPSSSNLASAIADETGSGPLVFANSPTLVSPSLGNANASSLDIVGVVTAASFDGNLATSNLTGTITNSQLAGSITNDKLVNSSVNFGGVTVSLGNTDSSPAFNLADATGLPISTGVSGLGTNVATFLETPSSSNLASAVTDETGSGALVFANSPTLIDPSLGNANATNINVSSGIVTAILFDGRLKGFPQNAQTSSYVLSSTDAGKHVAITTGGITINSGTFDVGDAVSIYNDSNFDQTISLGVGVNMRRVSIGDTGNRILGSYGFATILSIRTDEYIIYGTGLS